MIRTSSALVRPVVFAIGFTSFASLLLTSCSDESYGRVHGNIELSHDAGSTDTEPVNSTQASPDGSSDSGDVEGQHSTAHQSNAQTNDAVANHSDEPGGNAGVATDAPAADPPSVGAPSVIAPSVGAPTATAPTSDAPTSDAPAVDAPSVAAPSSPAPSSPAPGEIPPAQLPTTDEAAAEPPLPTVSNPLHRVGRVDSPIGTNLGGLADSDPSWPFVDAMKSSRAWVSGNTDGTWDDRRPISVDADGWVTSLAPNQTVKTLMFWDLDGRYPMGQYTVLYEGRGALEYFGGAVRVASSEGNDVIEVGAGGIGLTITALDAADPLRNIRVLMPGGACADDSMRYCDSDNACTSGATCNSFKESYATQVFHPQYLERLQTYGVLRFMDWGATNHSTQQRWDDRPKPTDARYSTKGVPVELMAELANRLGTDAWFTIPHLADDAYVSAYADTLSQSLRPDLKAYIEHSNEVWNATFSQSAYASSRGLELGLSTEAYEAQLRYHSRRSVEIFQIFEQSFSGLERLVRVMASQAANSWTSTVALEFENAHQYTDAIAVAPYFGGYFGGPDQLNAVRNMTVDEILDLLQHESVPETIAWMRDQAAVANAHGVALIAYEGGQHLAGVAGAEEDAQLNALFDAANRSPRMKTIYESYLHAWRDSGGELFTHFIDCGRFTKWGRWGSLEFLNQPRLEAPKYDALQSFIETNPVWW